MLANSISENPPGFKHENIPNEVKSEFISKTEDDTPKSEDAPESNDYAPDSEYETSESEDEAHSAIPDSSLSSSHISIIQEGVTLDDLMFRIVQNKRCKLCNLNKVIYKQKMRKHIKSVHLQHSVKDQGYIVLACKLKECVSSGRNHYHCPYCPNVCKKKYVLLRHFARHVRKLKPKLPQMRRKRLYKMKQCPHCGADYEVNYLYRHQKVCALRVRQVIITIKCYCNYL